MVTEGLQFHTFLFCILCCKVLYCVFLSIASIPEDITSTKTLGTITATETVPISTAIVNNTGIAPVSWSIQCAKTDEAISMMRTAPVSSSTQPINSLVGTVTTTIPVSSSTQPTNNSPSDGATTTSVIIVVAVVIILVVIVVGVVVLVVIFRTKKRKQRLVINKVQNVTEDVEMNLKQDANGEEANDHPPYAEIQAEVPPHIPSKSEDLMEYLNQNSTLDGRYSKIEL